MKHVLSLFSACLLGLSLTLPLAAETRVPQSQTEISLSFVPLVQEAAPAVVNIYARRVVEGRQSPFADDPFFGEFFRQFGQTRPRVQNSLGSGVILSDDGIVVSNYHVVGRATDIRVVLNNREEYAADVLLGDQESDLAILKLRDAQDMPHLTLRDSDTVQVGELVLAIGNPFGVGQTVTSGIVSGLARTGTATGNARGYFIQTDAPINPGNSGGALVDVQGQLIGINTSILSRSGGSNGIGFALPASLVGAFVEQAQNGAESFQRPWAGVTGQAVTADLAEGLGLATPEGVLLSDLHDESPLRAAGLSAGDVVTMVAGQPVNSPAEMLYRMSTGSIGQDVTMAAVRDGAVQEVAVKLMLPPDRPDREALTLTDREVLEGLSLARINPAVVAELGLPLQADGVVVTDPGPVGRRVGLRRGDVIRKIGRNEITRPSDVAAILESASGRVGLQVQRGGQRVILQFRL